MTDSTALARELAELDKASRFTTPVPWAKRAEPGSFAQIYIEVWPEIKSGIAENVGHNDADLIVALRNNLPAILRALCVQAAVGKLDFDNWNVRDWINDSADELLADCTGAKHG